MLVWGRALLNYQIDLLYFMSALKHILWLVSWNALNRYKCIIIICDILGMYPTSVLDMAVKMFMFSKLNLKTCNFKIMFTIVYSS